MKKAIILALTLLLLNVGTVMASSDEDEKVYSSGFSANSPYLLGFITDKNYNVEVNESGVVVNYLTSQFMTGSLLVNGELVGVEDYATYHTIAVNLEKGIYTIQPIAYLGSRVIHGNITTVSIK